MIEFTIMLLVVTAVLGSVSIWAVYHDISIEDFYNEHMHELDMCPYKCKWDLVEVLANETTGSTYNTRFWAFMRVPKKELYSLWHNLNKQGE